MMKIKYDFQTFSIQKYGGISRYFTELIKSNTGTISKNIITENFYINQHYNYFYIPFNFKGKNKLVYSINKIIEVINLKFNNYELLHPTYYDPYFLYHLDGKPFVLTVYDMIHEKFSEMFLQDDKTTDRKRLLVEKATKIIAISQSTKKDLIELFGTDESKIKVVYLGNSMFPKVNLKIDFEIPKKYLLFVGSRGGYKNFIRFIKSMASVLNHDKELHVICAGGGEFNNEEIELFNGLDISYQVRQYNLDDDSLSYFYKNAFAFIFPSLYEGFGIPILESFACGCPLICSNTSSLPEIASDGAYYFDPYSEDSIKNAIMIVLNDESLRQDMIQKGKERLKEFSWKQTAQETKKVYKEVLDEYEG